MPIVPATPPLPLPGGIGKKNQPIEVIESSSRPHQAAPLKSTNPTHSELGRQLTLAHSQLAAAKAENDTKDATIRELKATAAPKPDMPHRKGSFEITPQHDAIFAAMIDDSPGLGVMAVAGSGKTSTLVQGGGRMLDQFPDRKFAFVAFNRSNAETLRKRLPVQISSHTIHSLCWRAIQKARGWTTKEDNRIEISRLRQAASSVAYRHASGEAKMKLERELQVLWGLSVSTITSLDMVEVLAQMATEYGADVEEGSKAFELLPEMDAVLRSQPETISYDEMLRIVVEERLPLDQIDCVMVDEVQDLNRLQMEVVAIMKPRKVIVVGDPRQAIYAFRGSDHRAVDTMCRRFNITTRLPLSTTYRCAKLIANEARRIVREIQPLPNAPDGDVFDYPADRLALTLAEAKPGDLIVCRSNAPLIAAALYAHRKGLWPRISFLGGDSGTIANGLEQAQRLYGISDANSLAQSILDDNLAKAKDLETKGAGAVADATRDRGTVLALLLRMCGSVQAAQDWIKKLGSAALRNDAVNCATIHKAKGFEADRVIFLGHNLVPNRQVLAGANTALITQEWNLYYVAVTRAAHTLIKQGLDRENLSQCLMELLGKGDKQ